MDNKQPLGKPAPAKGIKHFCRAFRYTCQGLRTAWGESAFRQELFFGVISLPLPWIIGYPVLESLLLNICWVILVVVELLNTGVEKVVDLVSPQFHSLAKEAKDLCSAAVAGAILINVLAWCVIVFSHRS